MQASAPSASQKDAASPSPPVPPELEAAARATVTGLTPPSRAL